MSRVSDDQQGHLNHKQEPPCALVDTWVWMMNSSPDPNVQTAGRNRLVEAFGSLKNANLFHASRSKNG